MYTTGIEGKEDEMTDSFNETKRELYELMQRSRRERFTPPTPEGVTPSEARTMMTVSALQHTCEDVRPGLSLIHI